MHYLLIDTAGSSIQIGLFSDDGCRGHSETKGETLASLFSMVDHVLKEANSSLNAVDGFIFGEGPGSTLGLRVSALAIETWRRSNGEEPLPVFSFNRLNWWGQLIQAEGHTEAVLIAPWKRGHGFFLEIKGGKQQPILGAMIDEIPMVEDASFAWNDGSFPLTLPAGVSILPYTLPFESASFFHYLKSLPPAEKCRPFQIVGPNFALWDAQRIQPSP